MVAPLRILVTGATGCVGRAVATTLTRAGHTVRGTARTVPPDQARASAADWWVGDLRSAQPDTLIGDCDGVVHLAALVHRVARAYEDYHMNNVQVTQHLVAAVHRARLPPNRFVFASTVGVYGVERGSDLAEDVVPAPRTPYARSKLEGERAVLDAGGVVLRFPVVYGEGDRGNMARLARAIAARRIVLPTGPLGIRSFAAAENAAAGVLAALGHAQPASVYVITDDHDLPLEQLVSWIASAVCVPCPPRVPRSLLRLGAGAGSLLARTGLSVPLTRAQLARLCDTLTFSCEKAKTTLGYQPAVAPQDAISKMAAAVGASTGR